MAERMFNDIKLVLLGTTGTGRSATVQSILQGADSSVTSGGGWNSITNRLQMEQTIFDGSAISVLDTPGIHGDKNQNPWVAAKKTIDEASSEKYFERGVDAVLLVFSYNKRFGNDEVATVKILDHYLADGWLESHGIIVFTGGDNCRRDYRDESDFDFAAWCRNQGGKMGELFKKCDYRVVLFDNGPDNKKYLAPQLRQLMQFVNIVRGNNNRERLLLPKQISAWNYAVQYLMLHWKTFLKAGIFSAAAVAFVMAFRALSEY